MAEIILPKTSVEVAKGTYQELKVDSKQFIHQAVLSMQKENPLFLDHELGAAAQIALLYGSFDARFILGGSLFRYECTAREIRKKGGEVPFVGNETIQRSHFEVARLTDKLYLANGDMNAATRQRAMRVERDDPEIGRTIEPLRHVAPFVEGVHSTHLKFVFINETQSEPDDLPEFYPPSVMPLVGKSIVRLTLLETILDSGGFVDQTLKMAEKYIPEIVDRITRISDDIYKLFASFEISCMMQEFVKRQREFPVIPRGEQLTDPTRAKVNQAVRTGNTDLANQIIREYNMSILEEIKVTNPHLYWGISALLIPISKLGAREIAAALHATAHPYSNLKSKLS